MSTYQKMAHSGPRSPRPHLSALLVASYAFDWIILVVIVVVGGILGRITPNMRPFALNDPNIS